MKPDLALDVPPAEALGRVHFIGIGGVGMGGLARIMLAGSINSIQVSWVKLNRNLSQLCLHAGANDYGGTLMEENISREAGASAGQYTRPDQFQALILEAGRIPAERNTTYSRLHIKTPLEAFTSEHTMIPEFA